MSECIVSKGDAEEDKNYVVKSAMISEELDDLAIRFLDVIQSIIREQNYLQEVLSSGYVNMAKARYIMGNKSVSMLQVNEGEVMANCRVLSEMESFSSVKYVNFKINEECDQDFEKKGHQEVRHRKVKNQRDLVDEVDNLAISEDSLESHNQENEDFPLGGKNPLQWFGVLVPQSLRTCQSQFKESLVVAAKVASLKSELTSICARYRELIAKEKEIQK